MQDKTGHLPLFACGVSSGPLPLALKARVVPKSSRRSIHFLVRTPFFLCLLSKAMALRNPSCINIHY